MAAFALKNDLNLDEVIDAASKLNWSDREVFQSDIVESFLKQALESVDEQHLRGLSTGQFVGLLNEFWNWAGDRKSAEAKVRTRRVSNPAGGENDFTLLEIVGPDMAFLVSSIVGACRDMNIPAGMVLHPILEHGRGDTGLRVSDPNSRESYIQIYLDLLDVTSAQYLETEVENTLRDVRAGVNDFEAMQSRMVEAAKGVRANVHLDSEEVEEAADFLDWLASGHFIFLGSRYYRFKLKSDGSHATEEPEIISETNLGILRDQTRFILQRGSEPTIITDQISEFLNEPNPVIIAKATLRSRVHRRVKADYIGVKQFDDSGQVVGEIRFAGLFTAEAYYAITRDVPLIRRKVARVLEAAGRRPGSHDANALRNILETFPRDELFQSSEDDLSRITSGILQLQERSETRIFIREDRFDRFLSALVFVPRESFNSDLRQRIARLLEKAYEGQVTDFYPTFNDTPLARIQFLMDLKQDHPVPDLKQLEAEIASLARSWNDQVRTLIRSRRSYLPAGMQEEDVTQAFSVGYKDTFSALDALTDLSMLCELQTDRPVSMRVLKLEDDADDVIRARIYSHDGAIQLSECVPVLENMGLYVKAENSYRVSLPGEHDRTPYIHALEMRTSDRSEIDLDQVRTALEDAFVSVWTGQSENDGFNSLVLKIGASWREAAMFRTLARYRQQTGFDPAETTQIAALTNHPGITDRILKAFVVRFDPDLTISINDRREQFAELRDEIEQALNDVSSLDEDRVLRRLADLIGAIKRTSFFQRNEHGEPHAHIAIKIASRELDFLPEPKPFREIFVCAPHVEGVHLRFGPIARGGLRWSDRRDDFRTEVLGLVKAQQVKNAVIVPVGSKGGFYPKQLPKDGDREMIREEGIRAYKTFISALLMLTDNLIDGTPKSPVRTIIWDAPDPYLVVAADKGTATFSDIANSISLDYDFWLGDAFASGGSAGYDHKKMGITARGAWVAVQRHFRELGVDIQEERFSVIGVGDMSGDVFGNGMLLSRKIALKAAFNHLHIFIDPDPQDLEASFEERQRMFDLPRSNWTDYNVELISKGGGIFDRSAKKIELTPEIQAFLNIDAAHLTPNELIRAILQADADLLWFGGIGTYVKSVAETDLQVGDKANDGVRVNADELNVKVIGEGANLGVTQAARIAFAKSGGHINTDAVDNSAGVDSSDHEVNIKILLKAAIEAGELEEASRNSLLASMTDEVAKKVLVHNYDQTGALSVAEASASLDLDSHERMMERLEAAGILNRLVEGLPKPEEIRTLHETKQGLTRPEIAVLLAYAKITLFDELVDSAVPSDPFLNDLYQSYFPEPLRKFDKAMDTHRLKEEIISTQLANDIINLGGATFVHRVKERVGVETEDIARAFVASLEIFELKPLLQRIDQLDNQVPADVQIDLRLDLINALRRQVFWLASTRTVTGRISGLVDQYGPAVSLLISDGKDTLSPYERDLLDTREEGYREKGAPSDVAHRVAMILSMTSATDIVDLAARTDQDVLRTACLFSAVGSAFSFDRLRETALTLSLDQHWDRLAVRGLVETLLGQQNSLAERISADSKQLQFYDFKSAKVIVDEFVTRHTDSHKRLQLLLAELEQSGAWTFAKLVLFANAMRSFIEETDVGAT